jgi:hypothetical protein
VWNITKKVIFYNSALLKCSKLTVICTVKEQKLNIFLMLAARTNITEDKIVLRYEKSGVKIDMLSFFNSAVSLNL